VGGGDGVISFCLPEDHCAKCEKYSLCLIQLNSIPQLERIDFRDVADSRDERGVTKDRELIRSIFLIYGIGKVIDA